MTQIKGVKELSAALEELKNFTKKDGKSALRAAVAVPMRKVKSKAQGALAKFSPGKTLLHRTYRGRMVGAGFASRNLRMIVKFNAAGTSATAVLGVRAEAFYAVQFFEKGTAKIAKQPFLVPSLETSKETAAADAGAAFKKRILAVANKYARLAPKSEAK